MRHLKATNRRFGRDTAHRKAMFRNLVTSLVEKERITTTLHKAKDLRRFAEQAVTLAKKDSVFARRQARRVLFTKDSLLKLFNELGPRFKDRNGGYTRIVKIGKRKGDNADLAVIEFLGNTVLEDKKKHLEKKKLVKDAEKKTQSEANA